MESVLSTELSGMQRPEDSVKVNQRRRVTRQKLYSEPHNVMTIIWRNYFTCLAAATLKTSNIANITAMRRGMKAMAMAQACHIHISSEEGKTQTPQTTQRSE